MRRRLALIALMLCAAGVGIAQTTAAPTPTPTPGRHLKLDLGRLADSWVLGAAEPADSEQPASQEGFHLPPSLWPSAGTLASMRDARLAAWNSPTGRLEYAVGQSLGAPGLFKQPRGVALPPPVNLERGPDGKLRLAFLGPWSHNWEKLSDEEKLAVISQELVGIWILVGLLGHR